MTAAAATFCATLVDEWVRAGLTDAVIAPGSRSTPLALALAGHGGVRVHVVIDERSAGFVALGLGLGSGRPAVVLTTSGTATAELHPAVIEADLAGVPLLVCTADRPTELRDRGAPQTIDQTHLYGRSVRWFHDPGVADAATASTWRALATRAIGATRSGRPGPVHLNLPFREPLLGEPADLPPGRADGRPWTEAATVETVVTPLPSQLAESRGVIVAGRRGGDPDDVHRLAGALGWPVLADPRSGCRSPGLLTVAHADGFLRSAEVAARLRPDVVLRLGEPPASRIVNEFVAASGASEIVVAERWLDPAGTAAIVFVGSPRSAIASWAGAVPAMERDGEWSVLWRKIDDEAAAAISRALAAEPGLTEPGIARAVLASAPGDGVVVASSSMPVRDLEWYAEPREGPQVLANRGANGIDGVMSTAAGVALGGRPTVALVGDLAFLHDTNALVGLAARPVDLTLVVIDNDGGGIFSFLPQASELAQDRYEQLFGTPHGVDPVEVARAHGVDAVEVADLDALGAAVAKPSGAQVVVARSDRTENRFVHERLNAAIADAVRDSV